MSLWFNIHRLRIFAFWYHTEKKNPSTKMILIGEYKVLLHKLELCISVEICIIKHAKAWPNKFDRGYISYHEDKLGQFRTIQKHSIGLLQAIESHPWDFDFYAEYPLCMRMAEIGIAVTKNHF